MEGEGCLTKKGRRVSPPQFVSPKEYPMADTRSAHSIAYSRAPFSTWFSVVCLFVLFGLIVLAVIGPSPRTTDEQFVRRVADASGRVPYRYSTQVDWRAYHKVILDPVVVYRGRDQQFGDMSDKDRATNSPILASRSPGRQ